jgi:heat shock protein HtpX
MNAFATTFLMTFLTVIVVKVGRSVGGAEGASFALGIAILVHTLNYWLSDWIVLRLYRAKKIEPDVLPRLYRTIQTLTVQAQMPMPQFYLLPHRTATAFATGRDEKHAAVAVTDDIQSVNETELQRKLARDLSRLKNRERLGGAITASITGAIAALVDING